MATTPPKSWQPDLYDRSTTKERIETVAFTPMHPRLRNELITQSYGDIAEAMGRVLGSENASWSNLGLWASNSIGRYLAVPIPVIGSALSRPFAHGNRDVFADIGRAHVAFLHTVGEAHLAGKDTTRAWKRCRRILRGHQVEPPGNAAGDTIALWDTITENPMRPRGRPSNRLLRLGFRSYTRALELDGDDRARAILVGNILLALHEQRRLSLAISVGFRSWVRTLATLPRPMRTQFEWATRVPSDWSLRLENRWIGFATRHLVGISVPGDTIKVSRPVPDGERAVDFERWHLDRPTGIDRDMSDTEVLNQLFAALDVDGRPATCWNDHVQRMGYITSVFEQQQRSGIWFRGDGSVVRPRAWRRFDRALAKQSERVSGDRTFAAPEVGPCPVGDDLLDAMRQEPSHPPLPGSALLTFDAIRDPDQRRLLMGEILDDSRDRLEAVSGDNGLLSHAVCRQARDLYQSWSVLMLMGLLFRALPHDYAAARGVKVLGEISSLGTDSLRRAGETTHFVRDLLDDADGADGQLRADSDALRSVVGVRCLHSIVSGHLIDDGWDSMTYGVPVNQEDVLGTALSFAVPPIEMMRQLGAPISETEADAYTSYWLGIGHLLGTPLDAVSTVDSSGHRRALTFAEGQAVTQAIRRRHHARSIDGVRMTEALMSGVGDGFPRGFSWLSHGMLRTVGDPATTALLLSDTGPGRRRAGVIAWGLRGGLRIPVTRPATRWMVQVIGRKWLQPFVDAGERRPYRHPARHMKTQRIVANRDPNVWPFGC